MPELDWDLNTLVLFLSHATMCIPEVYRNRVFQDMALKLMEWDGFTMRELQAAYNRFGRDLKEICLLCDSLLEPGEACCEYEGQLAAIKPPSDDNLPPLPPSPVAQDEHPDHSASEEPSYSEPPRHEPTSTCAS